MTGETPDIQSEPPLTRVPPMPAALRIVAGVLSGLAGASSVWLLIGALSAEPIAWMPAGFWIVSILGSVLGVLLGVGRFATGPAMAAFCVGSTVVGAAGFGRLAEVANIRALVTDPYFLAHVGVGVLILCCGGLAVLVRRRGSFRSLLVGGGLAGFSLGAVGVVWIAWGSLTGLTGPLAAFASIAGILGAIAVGACFCAGVHYVIRAFEFGTVEPGAAEVGSAEPAGD